MSEESPEEKPTHAERVRGTKRNRSLKVLPNNSKEKWPANLGELLEWYTNEVEDVTKAAQRRLQDASKVVTDYRQSKTTFEEAAEAVGAHDLKWGDTFPEKVIQELRDEATKESRGRS